MPVGIGIAGAGIISTQYLTNLARYPEVEVVAIGDLDTDRAAAQAEAFGVPSSGSLQTVLDHPGVDIVVNLTIPTAHVEVSTAAIRAGKHVWSEKPLGLDRASARALLDEAASAGLRGLLRTGHRARPGHPGDPARDRRRLDRPAARRAGDHAEPRPGLPGTRTRSSSSQPAAGRCSTSARTTSPRWCSGSARSPPSSPVADARARCARCMAGPRTGATFAVTVPTTANVLLRHASGASSVCLFSFDSGQRRTGVLEFQWHRGHRRRPGPEPVRRGAADARGWRGAQRARDRGRRARVAASASSTWCARSPTAPPPRASGELAFHVLDIMLAIEESIASGNAVAVTSVPPDVSPLPADWSPLSPR